MSGSRPVDVASWTDGEASSIADTYHEDESAGKKRRHQGKQACQQCRRRKIKCDETRPKCRSCGKAKLTCEYELPAGQTRQQALVENQSKIQHELEAHASLISTLRTLPSDAAVEVLNRLREGQYDGILVGRGGSQESPDCMQGTFPWEYSVDNAEEDASGEDEEAYSETTASLPQSFGQTIDGMDFQSSQQSNPLGSIPYASMPQVEQNLPYPGYYVPYMAYQNPAGDSQTYGVGVSNVQLRPAPMEMPQQSSQQFHMGPPAEDPQQNPMGQGQRSKKTSRH